MRWTSIADMQSWLRDLVSKRI